MKASLRNPFKNHVMKVEFAAAVRAYKAGHRDLFLPSGERRSQGSYGSSFATFFWQGFDNTTFGRGWDAESKKMIGYATWRAGRACAEAGIKPGTDGYSVKEALLAEETAAELARRAQQAAEGKRADEEEHGSALEAALPALGDLSGGERTLLRRALVLYAQQWMSAKVEHAKAGDRYNAEYDQQRIDACDRLSERLRLGSVPPSAPAAAQELDPFVEIQRLRNALKGAC